MVRERTPNTMRKIAFASPILLTLLLMSWTALVYKHSYYDSWHVYPALAIVPLVLLFHLALIVWNRPRTAFVLYAAVHLAVLIPIWIGCLMLISKDSL
jgi:hypothetical protein